MCYETPVHICIVLKIPSRVFAHIHHYMYTSTTVTDFFVFTGNAYIMVPPKNTTAMEGTRVKLNCQAEGYPNNITYHWFKNDIDIQNVPGLMSRAGVYSDGSFVLTSVMKDDTGWYKCRPSNGIGPAPEAEAYLNITCK